MTLLSAAPASRSAASALDAKRQQLKLGQTQRPNGACCKIGSGTIETLTTLLIFYHGHGFNPSWVMLPDNATISKRVATDNEKTVPVGVVVQELAGFRSRMLRAIDEARKEMENG